MYEIYIKDVYQEFIKQEELGKLKIMRCEDMKQTYLENIYQMIKKDIQKYKLLEKPNDNYTLFLKHNFLFLF